MLFAKPTDGSLEIPSNVTRLCRALQPKPPTAADKEGTACNGSIQIVSYEPGIGSANNWW